jgi:CDP-diacylglycerol--inositol 3-phosphatidyltransferase
MDKEKEEQRIQELLSSANKEGLPTKVFLFIPNIVGYIRIICLLIAFTYAVTDYRIFMAFYIMSYILDQVDGMAARHFNQCRKN